MGAIGTGVLPMASELTSERSSRLSFSSLARRSMMAWAAPFTGVRGVAATGVGLGATGVGLRAGVAVLYMGGGAFLGVEDDGWRGAGLAATTTFGAALTGAGTAGAPAAPGRQEATSPSVGAARMSSTVSEPSPYTSSSWITSSARPSESRPMSKSDVSESGCELGSAPLMSAHAFQTSAMALLEIVVIVVSVVASRGCDGQSGVFEKVDVFSQSCGICLERAEGTKIAFLLQAEVCRLSSPQIPPW